MTDIKSNIIADLNNVLDADYNAVWSRIYVTCPDCGTDEDAGPCATCQSTGVVEAYSFEPDKVPEHLRKLITGYTMVHGAIVPKMRDKDKAAQLRAQVTTGVVAGSVNVKLDYAEQSDAEIEARIAALKKA